VSSAPERAVNRLVPGASHDHLAAHAGIARSLAGCTVAPTRELPRPAARKIVRLPPPGRCRRARACQPGECLFSLPRSARHISPVRHDCCRPLPMGWTAARTLPPGAVV